MAGVIYIVESEDEALMDGEMAFPTKAEALAFARELKDADRLVTVRRARIGDMPRRDLLCALFNREGFAEDQETILEFS